MGRIKRIKIRRTSGKHRICESATSGGKERIEILQLRRGDVVFAGVEREEHGAIYWRKIVLWREKKET